MSLTPRSRILFEDLDKHSGAHGNPCPLWNRKVRHRVHNSPPLDPILSHVHLINVPARISYDLQITIHI